MVNLFCSCWKGDVFGEVLNADPIVKDFLLVAPGVALNLAHLVARYLELAANYLAQLDGAALQRDHLNVLDSMGRCLALRGRGVSR